LYLPIREKLTKASGVFIEKGKMHFVFVSLLDLFIFIVSSCGGALSFHSWGFLWNMPILRLLVDQFRYLVSLAMSLIISAIFRRVI